MRSSRVRNGWVSRLMPLLGILFLFTACASTTVVVATPPPPSDDDDFSQLIAQMRSDLNQNASREIHKNPTKTATEETKKERDKDFAARAKALFAPLNGTVLQMPVVGVRP